MKVGRKIVNSITHAAAVAVALLMLGAASWPPCRLAALPPLPPELEYRIVGGDLVLIDTHASLIVDLLPRVLPD